MFLSRRMSLGRRRPLSPPLLAKRKTKMTSPPFSMGRTSNNGTTAKAHGRLPTAPSHAPGPRRHGTGSSGGEALLPTLSSAWTSNTKPATPAFKFAVMTRATIRFLATRSKSLHRTRWASGTTGLQSEVLRRAAREDFQFVDTGLSSGTLENVHPHIFHLDWFEGGMSWAEPDRSRTLNGERSRIIGDFGNL